MAQRIVLSGIGKGRHITELRRELLRLRPRAFGVAAAFVSIGGVEELLAIIRQCGEPECRLVAGTDNSITHPEALTLAKDSGWRLRLGKPQTTRGIFHPKLMVAGRRFSRAGEVQEGTFLYVGSSNLTVGGLRSNVECGFVAGADGCVNSASRAFAAIWNASVPATAAELRHYAARFAERARRRKVSELSELEINDARTIVTRAQELRSMAPPTRPAIQPAFAVAAWAGLQSFTGEYRFQLEFPRQAGEVISRLIRNHSREGERVFVFCPADESTREMQFRYYPDNGMFRLNIPNDVPGVDWARSRHDGLALVEQGPIGGAPLRLSILPPGTEAGEVVGRSAALGTWGRTPTRSYGWY